MSTTRLYFSLLFLPLVFYNFFSRGRLRYFHATVKPCKPNKQLLIAKTNKTWFSLHLGQIYKFTHAKEFQTRHGKNCFKHELTVSLYTAVRKRSAHVRAKKHTKNKITSESRQPDVIYLKNILKDRQRCRLLPDEDSVSKPRDFHFPRDVAVPWHGITPRQRSSTFNSRDQN